MQQNSTTTSAKKSVKRILKQHPLDLFLLAFVRPHQFLMNIGWRILGKKLRARSRVNDAIQGLPLARLRQYHKFGKLDRAAVHTALDTGSAQGFGVHLHIASNHTPAEISRAVQALKKQSTRPDRIFVTTAPDVNCDTPSGAEFELVCGEFTNQTDALFSVLKRAQSEGLDWIVPAQTNIQLSRHALTFYHAHLYDLETAHRNPNRKRRPALLYGDEAVISKIQLFSRTWLKPQWDPRMILSQDYISRACVFSVDQAIAVWEQCKQRKPTSIYEWTMKIGERHPIEHVPRTTALVPIHSWYGTSNHKLDAVRKIVENEGVEVSPGPFGSTRVTFPLPTLPPLVSVIVATRDKLELLRTCVEGVLNDTDYPTLELIIADNDSIEPETLTYLDEIVSDPRVQVVRWPHPFNYSAINNFAAKQASGEYICLLNNDIEVLEPGWLCAMVREAARPGVGAVGARLLYPDRSVQHAGVAIGIGNAAGHAHRGLGENQPGYYAQTLIARGASAVTGACLLVAKKHFDQVGGLDEEHLAVAYNDVDLCLKLRDLGLANIYTPEATLMHHESKSRGSDFSPENLTRYKRELKIFQDRWDTENAIDPWHHPFLERGSEVFSKADV